MEEGVSLSWILEKWELPAVQDEEIIFKHLITYEASGDQGIQDSWVDNECLRVITWSDHSVLTKSISISSRKHRHKACGLACSSSSNSGGRDPGSFTEQTGSVMGRILYIYTYRCAYVSMFLVGKETEGRARVGSIL